MRLATFLSKRHIDQNTLIRELSNTADIQQGFLTEFPTDKGLDIAASLHPAEVIGGDCYDLLRADDEQLMMYIGDVTGHGIPAGIVMAHANSILTTLARFCTSPLEILVEANSLLQRKIKQGTFMTTLLCQWDVKKKKFSYTSAGHERMIHYQAAKKKVNIYPPGGVALGIMNDIRSLVHEVEVPIEKDDFVVLYSDGIPEAESKKKEKLGMDRFSDIIANNAHYKDAQNIHDRIMSDVYEFMGNKENGDDITLLILKRCE